MKHLPNNSLKKKWISAKVLNPHALELAEREHKRCTKASGWNPKVVRIKGPFHIIDTCGNMHKDGVSSVKIVLIQDHPFLTYLNTLPHVPRAVKSIYKSQVRLAHERATEFWPVMNDLDKAQNAWVEYQRNMK